MGRNTRRSGTPQRRKKFTRLGESRVSQGVENGTYVGGLDSRVQQPVNSDE